jgi:hypothetical protein
MVLGCEKKSATSVLAPVMEPCENCTEPSGSIKSREFLNQLSNSKLLKESVHITSTLSLVCKEYSHVMLRHG